LGREAANSNVEVSAIDQNNNIQGRGWSAVFKEKSGALTNIEYKGIVPSTEYIQNMYLGDANQWDSLIARDPQATKEFAQLAKLTQLSDVSSGLSTEQRTFVTKQIKETLASISETLKADPQDIFKLKILEKYDIEVTPKAKAA